MKNSGAGDATKVESIVRITTISAALISGTLACAALPIHAQSLVGEARHYIGSNPTRLRHLWCGAFVDMVLRRTGHKGGGNLALGYLHYGVRTGPRVGAIAVMRRPGGGHVGIVSGFDSRGDPVVISGNTWKGRLKRPAVEEQVYPRRRIVAYVMPN